MFSGDYSFVLFFFFLSDIGGNRFTGWLAYDSGVITFSSGEDGRLWFRLRSFFKVKSALSQKFPDLREDYVTLCLVTWVCGWDLELVRLMMLSDGDFDLGKASSLCVWGVVEIGWDIDFVDLRLSNGWSSGNEGAYLEAGGFCDRGTVPVGSGDELQVGEDGEVCFQHVFFLLVWWHVVKSHRFSLWRVCLMGHCWSLNLLVYVVGFEYPFWFGLVVCKKII